MLRTWLIRLWLNEKSKLDTAPIVPCDLETQVTFRTDAKRKISKWHNDERITAIHFIKWDTYWQNWKNTFVCLKSPPQVKQQISHAEEWQATIKSGRQKFTLNTILIVSQQPLSFKTYTSRPNTVGGKLIK